MEERAKEVIDGFQTGKVPASSGVYAFAENNQIIYIGTSACLYERISRHQVRKGRTCTVWWKRVSGRRRRFALEKKLIASLAPPLNRQPGRYVEGCEDVGRKYSIRLSQYDHENIEIIKRLMLSKGLPQSKVNKNRAMLYALAYLANTTKRGAE